MKIEPMTRKEEIERASNQYAWANEYLRMDMSQCRRALATTPIEDLKMVNIGDIVAQAFLCGAAWADRTMSLAQTQKAGHVYIISNIGSFGEGVYKIGMTRRLEPMERVVELGDASVPFPFDVHGMIWTEDAPALEAALHRAFQERRVNVVNGRKEFFRVSLDEIRAELKRLNLDAALIEHPLAAQYRDSMALAI